VESERRSLPINYRARKLIGTTVGCAPDAATGGSPVNRNTLKQYVGIAVDVAFACGAYRLFGWIGFAVWCFLNLSLFASQLMEHQQLISKTLLSRLPDRCAFCHREIVDEGGVFDEEGIYHETCLEKLDSLEELRKEAGVRYSEAIQLAKMKKPSA
jgi:hypothetical protein